MSATRPVRTILLVGALAALLLSAASPAWAIGTAAGTVISNQATVDYKDANNNNLQALSNTVTTTVSHVGGVTFSPNRSGNANPSDVARYLHTLTNTGNAADTLNVFGSTNHSWTLALYRDDGDGLFEPGTDDTLLTDTNSDSTVDAGSMAADAAVSVWVAISVPAGTANGLVDTATVTAKSVFDPSKLASVTDTTTVTAPVLSVVKSVSPTGDQPPAAVLTYTIVVTNNGAANANSVVLTDPIPNNTAYVAASITQDGTGKTDGGGDDNADYNVTNAGKVTVTVGTLAPAASTTLTFQVRIN